MASQTFMLWRSLVTYGVILMPRTIVILWIYKRKSYAYLTCCMEREIFLMCIHIYISCWMENFFPQSRILFLTSCSFSGSIKVKKYFPQIKRLEIFLWKSAEQITFETLKLHRNRFRSASPTNSIVYVYLDAVTHAIRALGKFNNPWRHVINCPPVTKLIKHKDPLISGVSLIINTILHSDQGNNKFPPLILFSLISDFFSVYRNRPCFDKYFWNFFRWPVGRLQTSNYTRERDPSCHIELLNGQVLQSNVQLRWIVNKSKVQHFWRSIESTRFGYSRRWSSNDLQSETPHSKRRPQGICRTVVFHQSHVRKQQLQLRFHRQYEISQS